MIHNRLENLIDEMLEGQILLDEAISEFEKLYIKKALAKHKQHLSRTAVVLGIHRNTLAKRVATYEKQERNGTKIQSPRSKIQRPKTKGQRPKM